MVFAIFHCLIIFIFLNRCGQKIMDLGLQKVLENRAKIDQKNKLNLTNTFLSIWVSLWTHFEPNCGHLGAKLGPSWVILWLSWHQVESS